MNASVFLEMEFFLLVLFSIVAPTGIYVFLLKKRSISRSAVLILAIALITIAGIDVMLLQALAEAAKGTPSTLDDEIFAKQVSITLYLLPAAFAGVGVNLVSHVLINHLNQAEKKFDTEHRIKLDSAQTPGRSNEHFYSPYFHRIGATPDWLMFLANAIFMALIFALDFVTGTEIRLHVLYILPLTLIALNCAKLAWTIAALILMVILQAITFSLQALSVITFASDIAVAIAAALLTVLLARKARWIPTEKQHPKREKQGSTKPE